MRVNEYVMLANESYRERPMMYVVAGRGDNFALLCSLPPHFPYSVHYAVLGRCGEGKCFFYVFRVTGQGVKPPVDLVLTVLAADGPLL